MALFLRRRFACWLLGAVAIVTFYVYLVGRLGSSSASDDGRMRDHKRRGKGDLLVDEKDVARLLRSNHKQTEYIDRKGVHVVVGR